MATKTLSVKALRKGDRKAPDNDWDTLVTQINQLVTLVTELKADMDANNNIFDAHSHEIDTTNTSVPSDETAGTLNGTLVGMTADVTAATPDTLAVGN